MKEEENIHHVHTASKGLQGPICHDGQTLHRQPCSPQRGIIAVPGDLLIAAQAQTSVIYVSVTRSIPDRVASLID